MWLLFFVWFACLRASVYSSRFACFYSPSAILHMALAFLDVFDIGYSCQPAHLAMFFSELVYVESAYIHACPVSLEPVVCNPSLSRVVLYTYQQ